METFLVFLRLMTLARNSAFADEQAYSNSWYIAPQYSYAWPDSKRDVVNGGGWPFDIGAPVSDTWNLELGVTDYKTDHKNGLPGSSHETAYGVNCLWFFGGRSKDFAPFAEFGAGANDQRTSYSSSQINGYGNRRPGIYHLALGLGRGHPLPSAISAHIGKWQLRRYHRQHRPGDPALIEPGRTRAIIQYDNNSVQLQNKCPDHGALF